MWAMKIKIIFLTILLSGCVNPSTMMVNREGQTLRCAATGGGYGIAGAIAITAANQAHNGCVSDYQKIGFVKIPDATLGVELKDWNSPLVVKTSGSAEAAGIKPGDQIVSVDSQSVANVYDVFRILDGKSAGDKVKVIITRDDKEMTFEPVLVSK
jgi:S1-C subfamily serine protease